MDTSHLINVSVCMEPRDDLRYSHIRMLKVRAQAVSLDLITDVGDSDLVKKLRGYLLLIASTLY